MNYRTTNRHKSHTTTSARARTSTIKKIIVFVIFALIVIVIGFVIASYFLNPERQVEAKFTALANNYYENIFYDQMTKSTNYEGDPAKALGPYETTGLAPLTLRQLLLYDEAKTSDTANYLLKYCDENETSVTLYPDPPYEKSSYHAEYTYSCNF